MRVLVCLAAALWLTACATTQTAPAPLPPMDPTPPPISAPIPDSGNPYIPSPAPPIQPAPVPPIYPPTYPPAADNQNVFNQLPYWQSSDMRPALTAFKRSCAHWSRRSPAQRISDNHPEYGSVRDWLESCRAAENTPDKPGAARSFFENNFYPLLIGDHPAKTGLITGYYQPEIQARKRADLVYSEPILEVPPLGSDRLRPRSEMGQAKTRVIAYGRPIDVFFMQVQGSGVLSFPNGQKIRAAYAGNNGYDFTAIGRVLVDRGEMTLDQTSLQSIEAWMENAGPQASRALMNENKRYIFFAEQVIKPGEGPMGGMRVPLTSMGSIAVDTKSHPYGAPLWLTLNLPRRAGDYVGEETGQLLIAQDTGKAITGFMRGDFYFGSGLDAGGRAGVMKHRASWVVLLPNTLPLPLS